MGIRPGGPKRPRLSFPGKPVCPVQVTSTTAAEALCDVAHNETKPTVNKQMVYFTSELRSSVAWSCHVVRSRNLPSWDNSYSCTIAISPCLLISKYLLDFSSAKVKHGIGTVFQYPSRPDHFSRLVLRTEYSDLIRAGWPDAAVAG